MQVYIAAWYLIICVAYLVYCVTSMKNYRNMKRYSIVILQHINVNKILQSQYTNWNKLVMFILIQSHYKVGSYVAKFFHLKLNWAAYMYTIKSVVTVFTFHKRKPNIPYMKILHGIDEHSVHSYCSSMPGFQIIFLTCYYLSAFMV